VIPRPAAPAQLPSLTDIDDYLAFLKRESQVWREFRKVVAAREEPEADDEDGNPIGSIDSNIQV